MADYNISEGVAVHKNTTMNRVLGVFFLIYIIMMIVRVPYVASYTDDFLFKLPFGPFRYLVYLVLLYLCVMEIFARETHEWIRSRMGASIMIILGLMVFISVIIISPNKSFAQGMNDYWAAFISTVKVKGGFVGPSTGFIGYLIYSIINFIPGVWSIVVGVLFSWLLMLIGLSLLVTFRPFYLYIWIVKWIKYHIEKKSAENELYAANKNDQKKYPFAEKTTEIEIRNQAEQKMGPAPSPTEFAPDKYRDGQNPYAKFERKNKGKSDFFSKYRKNDELASEHDTYGPFGKQKAVDIEKASQDYKVGDIDVDVESSTVSHSEKSNLFTDTFADEYEEELDALENEFSETPDEALDHFEEITSHSHANAATLGVKEDFEKYEDKSAGPKVQTAEDLNFPKINFPSTSLLKDFNSSHTQEEINELLEQKKKQLLELFLDFKYEINIVNSIVGASVIRFEVESLKGVRVGKITNMVEDIKLALGSKEVFIQAPIPGKSLIGIEISNPFKEVITFKSVLEEGQIDETSIQAPLGKNIIGEPIVLDIQKAPHLLIAGATGSGKSVCINSIIMSVAMRYQPSELRLILVDPKRVELAVYKELPHLMSPIINSPKDASNALKQLIKEMNMRFDIFTKNHSKNLEGYNASVSKEKRIPKILIIIDELADLMMTAGKEVEESITRLTQLARAAGIHLVVATQRPSVDVITGLIKSNIPSRIAFAVSSGIDSRTILGTQGAETLLGNGDMLYQAYGSNDLERIQGTLVTDEEITRIVKVVKSQAKTKFDPKFEDLSNIANNKNTSTSNSSGGSSDSMYEECKNFVIENKKASSSLLQRKFGLGYNRAARIIDSLEEEGIIGPQQGSKPREILK